MSGKQKYADLLKLGKEALDAIDVKDLKERELRLALELQTELF